MSLFDFLLLMAVLYGLTQLFKRHVERGLERELQGLEKNIEYLGRIYKKVTVEQHGDMLYIWEYGTDHFLFQGSSAQDFKERVPHDMVLSVVDGDPEVIKQFKLMFPREESI